jgi:NAD dependent epimerase/dehydratase family enzyme
LKPVKYLVSTLKTVAKKPHALIECSAVSEFQHEEKY